jgi:hypothetical protein
MPGRPDVAWTSGTPPGFDGGAGCLVVTTYPPRFGAIKLLKLQGMCNVYTINASATESVQKG